MARIDIVVFPNGGREIFGQVKSEPAASAAAIKEAVDAYVATLPAAQGPRKYTGYYDSADPLEIEWLPYDANNPIVFMPVEPPEEEYEDGMAPPEPPAPVQYYEPVELAQVPEALIANIVNPMGNL